MRKRSQLTTDSVLDIVRRQLLVRVLIGDLPTDCKSFGRTRICLLSRCADEDTNQTILSIGYSFNEPNRNLTEAINLGIDDFGFREEEWRKKIPQLLELWKPVPFWLSLHPAVVCLMKRLPNDSFEQWSLPLEEQHVLQHLARLQVALAATIKMGHEHQYYLCDVYYRLSALIAQGNRRNEQVLGLLVQTPVG